MIGRADIEGSKSNVAMNESHRVLALMVRIGFWEKLCPFTISTDTTPTNILGPHDLSCPKTSGGVAGYREVRFYVAWPVEHFIPRLNRIVYLNVLEEYPAL